MNWLDWLIVAIVALSVFEGFKHGFVRVGIGFAALIVAFFAASWFHGMLSPSLVAYVKSKTVASLLSYALVFGGVMLAGTLLAELIARVLKIVGLSFFDRVLGGIFGFARALLVIIIAGMVMMAFAPKGFSQTVANSRFGPSVLGASEIMSAMTPYEIKDGFRRGYAELRESIAELGHSKKKKELPVREE